MVKKCIFWRKTSNFSSSLGSFPCEGELQAFGEKSQLNGQKIHLQCWRCKRHGFDP